MTPAVKFDLYNIAEIKKKSYQYPYAGVIYIVLKEKLGWRMQLKAICQ
jgi:hypothetical protein